MTSPRTPVGSLDPTNPPDLESFTAEEVIAWALERFGNKVELACSFQQEESVMLDILARAGSTGNAFALDTGLLFDETHETWQASEQRFGIKVASVKGIKLEQQAAEHGAELWTKDPAKCCGLRKVEPLQRRLSQLDAWITGVRREQSPTRADSKKIEWDARNGLWKFNPLADWTKAQVWDRITERELPYNQLHDSGYSSIGCVPCTNPGEGREGRWSGSGKTECGLHG
ncbi:MAG: phosphoadenylyl-sulfate reductase [Solirubrobacterales bacterium]|nr:phosphoadenylyl-sulfate reductase [Solirubrobacterales bacterium]